MSRILKRPMFRKGGLSQTARPSYRGGGVTAIRPGYRGGGMNGIMSGIVPRRGYADGPATPEEILERIQVQGLPYLTLPKIEDKYQSFIKRQDPITFPEEGSLVSGYGEGKEALYDFYQTPQGEKYFKEPLIEKMKKQVAERKAKGLDVSDDAIVEEPEKTTTENELDTSGVVDTKSQFEKYFDEYLPVIQEQLGPDSDAASRDKWLALAKFSSGVLAQPGGDLTGTIGRAAEKPLEDLSKISAEERQAKQVPKMLALQAAMNRMKGPTATDRSIDAQRIENIAKGFIGEGIQPDVSYILADKLDKLRGDPELAGKFNKKLPTEGKEGTKQLKKLKGKHFFYTEEGELKIFDGDKQEFLTFAEYKALPKDKK